MFYAAAETGAYCRAGCPIRPRPRYVRSFPTAAAAEVAGYRACLRCRPYRSPHPVDRSSPDLVWRGVQLVRAGARNGAAGPVGGMGGEATRVAGRLGVPRDDLCGLFLEHVGATPEQVGRSHHTHFARRLLDDTDLTVADVAVASGFGDPRDLAGACVDVFGVAPAGLRSRRWALDRIATDRGLVLRLPFAGPLDWEAMLSQLAERAVAGVERIADGVYRRTVVVGGDPTVLEVTPRGADHLALRIHSRRWDGLVEVVERVRRIFALDADPDQAVAHLRTDPALGGLVATRPGLRVPGTWDAVETGVRTIVGQQATAAGATAITGRLVARHGTPVPELGLPGLTHTFPSAATLAAADLADLGLTRSRADAVRAFARAVVDDRIRLDRSVDLEQLVSSICAIPGIEPSTAHYIAGRSGESDAYPATEPAARRALLPATPVAATAPTEVTERWRPWRALAAVHLWMAERDAAGGRRLAVAPLPMSSGRRPVTA